ncbi:protein-methionine-sulfoxide reductase catalytic subunit MsrP [Rhizobiales bacterium TNE-4]|nr:protein-methionine-sulfoxide reductase catalytic subunit MsrP [Rhizobiales bacterium TNE-4]MBV1826049.1 protein-methionine-sulfoxide reductase catalytic subunit MsrP [Rhizobiales bacterium TNE-4]
MPRFNDMPRIAPSDITPQGVWLNRRHLIAGAAALGGAGLIGGSAQAAQVIEPLKAATGFPAPSDPPSDKKLATTYNNYYEFGTSKSAPAMNAHRLTVRPWSVEISGEVSKPRTIGIEELLAFPLEERIYRFRCVEAWSMVVPWIGFEFNKLAALVEPTSRAKFVRFTTAERPSEMPGLGSPVLDWPYTEALRIDEAMHPLTLVTLGMYGETLPNQNGAPVRLVVPWKYGYKSAKSIVKIEFVEKQPVSSWTKAASHEYGFYSNVNPNVDHPRWSQKRERLLPALFASRETEMFNGYGAQVASLYAGMDLKVNH